MFESIEYDYGKPTLARIDTCLGAISPPHCYQALDAESIGGFCGRSGLTLLLFVEDPLRVPESWDVAVILADALKRIAAPVRIGLLAPDAGRPLAAQYGIGLWPALVGLRDGAYLGTIEGMMDWAVFERRLHDLLAAPAARLPGIGIPVVAAGVSC